MDSLSKEWKQWQQVWDAHEEVTDLQNKKNRLCVPTFITCIGKEALEVHNGLPFASEEEKSNMTKVLESWETHCIGKTNVIYERSKFNSLSQEQTESIDAYVNAIRALAETCDFRALKDQLIRDRILGLHLRDEANMLVYQTIAKCCSIFA